MRELTLQERREKFVREHPELQMTEDAGVIASKNKIAKKNKRKNRKETIDGLYFNEGLSMEAIGKRLRICKGRVHQILRETAQQYATQISARQKVANAIKTGRLIRLPCEICGAVKSEGHHEDYEKPLEVLWLCRKHHSALHKGKLDIPQSPSAI